MWEFDIIHKITQETTIIFGYSLSDAFRRTPSLNPNEWECLGREYID
jgi:hypothetical protein